MIPSARSPAPAPTRWAPPPGIAACQTAAAGNAFWYGPGRLDHRGQPRRGPLTELDTEQITLALAGDQGVVRALVAELTPVIQARVGRALLRRRALAKGNDVRQMLDDMVQDVFVELFRDDGKALRAWDPARGLGLRGYVGLVAEQRVAAVLRSRRRNPWSEDLAVDDDAIEEATEHDDPELRIASRQEIEKLFDLVRASLTPLGRELFQRLLLDEESVAGVCAATGMSTSAVQAWSSRLKRLVQRLALEIAAERPSPALEVQP